MLGLIWYQELVRLGTMWLLEETDIGKSEHDRPTRKRTDYAFSIELSALRNLQIYSPTVFVAQ